ncbi:MAG TPA: cytochrome c oxidase subunit II [Longimicrobiales bacterium]|nr:cytochrome c oxidase subunit II [Longimicrobiales bacterium]
MGWLPEAVSTYAGQIDGIFYLILAITGVIFVGVEAVLLWFVLAYRHREGREAYHTHGNIKVEVIWTAVPAVLVVLIGVLSIGPWLEIRGADSIPDDAYAVDMTAKQFEWNATYVGSDGEMGTDDDVTQRNQLHIPVGRPVVVTLRSEDVIHSFFLPQFRVKQDAVPGMETPVWFEATQEGEFQLACAELCGTGHTRMGGRVIVHSAEDFDAWLLAEGAGPPLEARLASTNDQP